MHPGENQLYGSDRDTVMGGNACDELCGLPGRIILSSRRHRNVYIRVLATALTAWTFWLASFNHESFDYDDG